MLVKVAACLSMLTLALGALAGCGSAATPTGSGAANPTGATTSSEPIDGSSASRSTTQTQTEVAGKPATVVNQGGKIIITGSGDSTIGPLDFDQPYYVVRSSGTASLISAVETDGIGILVAGTFGTKLFRVSSGRAKGDRFEVTADGGYRIEMSPPSTLPAPVAPPATLSGTGATEEIYGPFAFDKATTMVLTYKGTSKGALPVYTIVYETTGGTMEAEAQITGNGDMSSEPEPISAGTKGFVFVESQGAWEITFGS